LKKKVNVGIIGAGNMGEAIIRGLGKSKEFFVYIYEKDKARSSEISKNFFAKENTLEQLIKQCKIIIICVKPQDIDKLIFRIKGHISTRHLLISIAAGITTAHIEKSLDKKVAVIRTMPNLPGLIGQGFTAYCLGKRASKNDAQYAKIIFKTIGKVLETKENKMDAITAISSSGPGFIAYFIEVLQAAAVDIGLDEKEARLLAVNAAAGTANMLLDANIDPAQMVKRVASPGGTTEAGLKELHKGKLKLIGARTLKAAKKRAKELSK